MALVARSSTGSPGRFCAILGRFDGPGPLSFAVGPKSTGVNRSIMKAAWYEKQGPPSSVLVVGEMTTPEPDPGEVRISIAASGINPGDVKKREDTFGVGMPGTTGSVLRPHASDPAGGHGVGVPNPWHPCCLRSPRGESKFLELDRNGARGARPTLHADGAAGWPGSVLRPRGQWPGRHRRDPGSEYRPRPPEDNHQISRIEGDIFRDRSP